MFDHDMNAFVAAVQESLEEAGVGEIKDELHKLLTSYDVEDPALILRLRHAVELILTELIKLERVLRQKAHEHQWTVMTARTHGQVALPSTFGQLLLVYSCAIGRSTRRLRHVIDEELGEAKMSGAVGNYAGMNPALEKYALEFLGLRPAMAETQILQRDRHAALVSNLAIMAGTIEQICFTFWLLMQEEVHELQEPRAAGKRDSSFMPQGESISAKHSHNYHWPKMMREPHWKSLAKNHWRNVLTSSLISRRG